MRELLKSVLPSSVRRVLRSSLHYAQRVARWPIILWQVRGRTLRDELVLIGSALASPATSARALMSWQDPQLLRDADVVVPGLGRFSLRARSDDLWHVLPWRERRIVELIERTLRPGDTFVDAGANIGCYTVQAARLVGKQGRVVAIEMMPDTASRLRAHVVANGLGNVTVLEYPITERDGLAVQATVTAGKYGQASIARGGSSVHTAISLVGSTLDTLLAEVERIALMKLDLEGAESGALAGGKLVLQRTEAIVLEARLRDEAAGPVLGQLAASGFWFEQLDGNNIVSKRNQSA